MKIPEPMSSIEERVAMATRCRDCDDVPKVADAGLVFEGAGGQRVQIMHNGLKVLADGYYGQWMTDLIRLCRGHHEVQEEKLFHEVERRLPDDANMIELGGFWAYYSLWFLMNRPQRQAVVIEPEPTHLAVGKMNAELNGLAPMFKAGFAGGSFAPDVEFQCEASGWQRLPRYSVEHLMQEQCWSHLNLLHLDIQGAETEVLTSCRGLFLNGQVDWVFVSTHAHQISGDPLTHQRCLSLMRECGATIEAEHDVHESFSGDGLIVARFGPPPPNWRPVEISSNRASRSLFRHLAYDLNECMTCDSSLHAQQPSEGSQLHESLRAGGTLFTLQDAGPLGEAGTALLLPNDEVMSPHIKATASWDYGNVEAFASQVRTDKSFTLVDIGANIGLFSRQLFSLGLPIGRFLCVEPDPANFRALQYNLFDIGERIELFNIALSAQDGVTTLLRDLQNIGNYSLNEDAMRDRSHDTVQIKTRSIGPWMIEQLGAAEAILWKSDTQGLDEMIVAETPMEVWERIDVALLEMWRIVKPDYDRDAFRARIESFPNRALGDQRGVSTGDVIEYLAADDWQFKDLLLWR